MTAARLASTAARVALVAGDHQAAARGLAADLAGVGEVDRGLGLVGEPQHGRQQPGLGQGAHRGRTVDERRPAPALVDLHLGQRAHPHGHRGDHAEGALGAQEQLAQVRTGGVGRRAAEVDPAARGGDASGRRPARRSGRSRRWTGRWTGSRRSRRSRRTRRTAGSGRGSAPRAASSASASGPRRPGSRVAVIDTWSTASSRFIRTRSRLSTPAKPSRRATRPPVTDVPPPNGHHGEVVLDREVEDRGDLLVARRAARRRRGRRSGRRRGPGAGRASTCRGCAAGGSRRR